MRQSSDRETRTKNILANLWMEIAHARPRAEDKLGEPSLDD